MPPKRPWLLARIRVAQSAYDQRDSHRQGRPHHRTIPRSPKGHALDKIHEPNHLRTAGDHCLKRNRAQLAGARGRRREHGTAEPQP